MKKKLFALSGVFLIVLVVTGLWATKAFDLMGDVLDVDQNATGATSLVNGMSMEEMTQGSAAIVVGNCVETRSQWNDGRLFTLATISVMERIKGDSSDNVTVVLPGGIDSNRRFPVAMTYAGAPQISKDEKVFLFLTPEDEIPDSYAVMGFAQGKFSIVSDTEGGEVVSRDPISGPAPRSVGITRGNLQFIPLEEFKARVRSFLR
jgi:hypothetical protein